MTEFRHKIGDALFDLYTPYEMNDAPDQTVMYPIVKRTDRFVYVHGRSFYNRDKLIRFSVEDLERDGRAWNQANRMSVYTRPLPHWPLMDAEVRKPEQPAITA